jgi:hypothetical protein
MSYNELPLYKVGFVEMLQFWNTSSHGLVGMVLPFVLFAVLWVSMKPYENARAMMAATFITMFLCVLLRLMDLIATWELSVFVVLFVVAVIYFMSTKGAQ